MSSGADKPEPPPSESISPYWLRRADQATIAAIVLVLLVTIAGYWLARGGHRGRLIDFDLAPPRTAQFQVDINAADVPELMTLPEVGPSLATAITEHRATHGPFARVEDLDQVRGIGPKTLDKLRPFLRGFRSGETEPELQK